ncbi:MAG TPA: stage II sporulation protein M [Candidatus Paceibacterota bacterium]|nr:stage II sporulation protein M [Candidatus Paceibacterota bacterium]
MKKKIKNLNKGSILLFFLGLVFLLFSYFGEFIYGRRLFLFFFGLLGIILSYTSLYIYFKNDKNNFLASLNFIKDCRYYILFTIILFLFMCIVGYFFKTPEITEIVKKTIEELLQKTKDLNFIEMFIFIFRNNLSVSFFSIILGIFFSIFPFFTIISNGYVLGFVFEKSVSSLGFLSLFRLFPHGVFELPAIFLSISFGLKLGLFIFSKNIKSYIKKVVKESFRVLVFVIIPLLLIAAIIETSLIFLLVS